MKARRFVRLALLLSLPTHLIAQTCSNTNTTNTLVCAVPQLFGPGGLTLPNTHHSAHFTSASLSTFRPVNTAIGEELTTLPLGSAGSGVSFTFTPEHIPISTEDSLGPILTERAGVIGRKKIDIGVAYQYFKFDKIDGQILSGFPAVLGHAQFLIKGQRPDFENDYITTATTVTLDLHQTVLYGVFGISNRIDVSAEIPIQHVSFGVNSNANIVRTVACELTGTCSDSSSECGEYHYFDAGTNCSDALASTSKTFTNGGSASGIGDVILRGKGQVFKGEKVAGSIGIAFRLPSGDQNNFLGSGTVGVAPFGAFTYRARLSPHVRVGYQWNGRSILAGDPTSTTTPKASLPASIIYSAGADLRASRRITFAVDLIGQRVLEAERLALGTFTDWQGNVLPSISSHLSDYNSDSIGAGTKIRLKGELVLIGNVTTRIDDGGLHSHPVPLIGASYAF